MSSVFFNIMIFRFLYKLNLFNFVAVTDFRWSTRVHFHRASSFLLLILSQKSLEL